MSTSTSSTDAILARAQLHLAATQRLVSSWLPPPSPPQTTAPQSSSKNSTLSKSLTNTSPSILASHNSSIQAIRKEILDEDEEVILPERSGLGASLPTHGVSAMKQKDEVLRKRLFGHRGPSARNVSPSTSLSSKPRQKGYNGGNRASGEADSDEEEGRSGIGKDRRADDIGDGGESKGGGMAGKRKGGYLDEVLKDREGRKKKRRREKGLVNVADG